MRLSLIRLGALSALGTFFACSSSNGNDNTIGGPVGGGNNGGGGAGTGGLVTTGGSGNSATTGGTGGGGTGGTGATTGTTGGGGSGGGSGGTGGVTTGGSGGVIPTGGSGNFGNCPVTTIDGGCAGELYAGETIPLDIYIMFDISGSMINDDNMNGSTRLDEVRTAVTSFLNDPASIGIGVGIGYFGDQPIGSASCDPADYTDYAVPIAPLPGNAPAIINNLAMQVPTGETPTGAAIRGACTYASNYKATNLGHEVVMLFVTDGKPEAPVTSCTDSTGYHQNCGTCLGTCCPTIDDAVAAATECLNGSPPISTYVLGIDSAQQNLTDNMNLIAQAGGTNMAYIVSATGNASQDVLNALNTIRSSAQVPCDLQLPPPPTGETLDFQKVNIIRTSGTCETQILSYTTTITQCDPTSGGWYYDDPNQPSQIHLCPTTCDAVSIPGSQLTFALGCDTIIR